ncbi:MAG: exodeoxyribonuclease VII large subunit [Candidatus Marinimicrobia bacterium]|nr:exodeoxyribonuclease VII large subunit [Candidatus Neomarinimicrobiota bacterium]
MLNILSVSDITAQIKSKLEKDIPDAMIRAEISECKFHSSGHIYLTLKDPGAVLPAVIWRTTAQQLTTKPTVGMEVIVYGRLSVFAPHGKYQFIIQSLQDAGRGELYIKYEVLKAKLIEDGLCALERKKAIPKYPLHIGLVTSETGAALQDMLRVFAQDAPHVRLSLSSARVQGKGAAQTVIDALEGLKVVRPDVVICARGGGSIEDLWEFNDERLARYIADYPTPLITGIGHETDTTIVDLVSDHRASTPTNAAEMICAPWRDVRTTLNQMDYTLSNTMIRSLDRQKIRLNNMQRYLSSRQISENLQNLKDKILSLMVQISKGINNHIQLKLSRFKGMQGTLFAYSPENVLKKGYTLIRDRNDNLLRSVEKLNSQDLVSIQFHDGTVKATVNEKENKG